MARSDIPHEAVQTLGVLRTVFGESLQAVWLHGSAVEKGLRPDSDVDILAVVDKATVAAERRRLVDELMLISGPPRDEGPRPVELIVVRRADLAPTAFPARSEFVYGEWLREDFVKGFVPESHADPEMTLILAQARRTALALFGTNSDALLPDISPADVRRAMSVALPALLGSLQGDERNVLLTLARMWYTAETGRFASKDDAAEWAAAHLDEVSADLLGYVRRAYLGEIVDDWSGRRQTAEKVADLLAGRLKPAL
ncbi:DUF4111 domain-containing protein [Mesorhizobium sp. YIM 152430]|uniref:aminoglycoside adenylyltransferase domain-containing protein n=1 Tax=Mesorhizobium sp. YIM 152430 TaxID=3031761 RepID=UPI0023DB0D2C|nr:aminoglycoside adenylyltransferase domain-containing protein [Mesorhizobium sp. YIM 152430]MDF1598504.1 DUF4111 domain-containing protein [Mesorhizobium sp. YIM 152430]